MKSKNIIFTIVLVLIILVVIMVKFIPNILNNKNNYDDLVVYKNNNIVTISDQEKSKITEYLKKEDFNKVDDLELTINGEYKIMFNNIEISFDNNNYCYYKNNNTLENYYSNITNELRGYIIDIAN